jgi:outer membrane lipoprotein-sorting protein
VTPADVRGVGFLRLAEDRMYLYLPAFRRVRRIASSIKNQNFMGTDFSYEDMSQTRFGDDFAVTAAEAGSDTYTITLEPKVEADVSYARIVMEVQRSNWVYTRIDYYDSNGERVKTLTASDVVQTDGYWIANRLEMVSWKSGHRTVLDLEELSFDSELSDDLFTERALKRPI